MNKYTLILISLLLTSLLSAQEEKYDPTAILLLDKMSGVISSLTSVSFEIESAYDEYTYPYGMVKKFAQSEVHMVGPDKMIVNSHGAHGHRQFWYNGVQFGYFDYAEKNFGLVEAPGTIINMIDSIHQYYDVDFPAADFFYPAFTDDLIESCHSISYVGETTIQGKSCFSVLAVSDSQRIQIWISNDSYNLPVRYTIVNAANTPHQYYEATFTNWKLNPDLPEGMFDFSPPPGAHEVILFSKTDK